MADDIGSWNSPQRDNNATPALADPRTTTPRTRIPRQSYASQASQASQGSSQSGQSSRTTSGLHVSPNIDDAADAASMEDNEMGSRARARGSPLAAASKRRLPRPRPAGGFLLSNSLHNERPPTTSVGAGDAARRRSKIPLCRPANKGKGASSIATSDHGPNDDVRGVSEDGESPVGPRGERLDSGHGAYSRRSPAPKMASPRHMGTLDLDTTHIVNMALNLSESRRLSQRRAMSSPAPPRLTPLPDVMAGGSLKHHLQQQRRTSRNMSPRADRAIRNLSVSSQRTHKPVLTSLDPEAYNHHFSTSTLERTQKAKEHFELMAQYRRLLQLVPPLKSADQPGPSPSPTPVASKTPERAADGEQMELGRPYNPLQYIRNQKVRARERRPIDGEAGGFADLSRVTDWVDEAERTMATSSVHPNGPALPPFPGANAPDSPSSVPSSQSVPTSSKARRQRFDWAVDPADMLADVCWLEQDDNRCLVEDRHFARIYAKAATGVPKPRSQHATDDTCTKAHSLKDGEGSDSSAKVPAEHVEISHTSTRDRARRKLHNLKGNLHHHGHGVAAQSHYDLFRPGRPSLSDTSGSETDRRRRGRSDTVTASGQAVLEKQMNEILAREADEVLNTYRDNMNVGQASTLSPSVVTMPHGSVEPSEQEHSRAVGADLTESINRCKEKPVSPIRSPRSSLEVPVTKSKMSLELYRSISVSPDLPPSRRDSVVPEIGVNSSPPLTRPTSPTRNPFSKVKNIFRERSREHSRERARTGHGHSGREDGVEEAMGPVGPDSHLLSPVTSREAKRSLDRARPDRPESPVLKVRPGPIVDGYRSHRSKGSARLRGDEQHSLRSILKGGTKIDSMVRGGVSKVSDMIWKKDSELEESGASEVSDAGLSPVCQRRSMSVSPSEFRREQEARGHLDAMPSFKSRSVSETPTPPQGLESTVPISRTPPRRDSNGPSSRFYRLKPPRVDVLNGPPAPNMVFSGNSHPAGSKFSDSSPDVADNKETPPKIISRFGSVASLATPQDSRGRDSLALSQHCSNMSRNPWSQRTLCSPLSRCEIARIRALMVASGIKAREIARRAAEPQLVFGCARATVGLSWMEVSSLAPPELAHLTAPHNELYPATAKMLEASIASSNGELAQSVDQFRHSDMRALSSRIDTLHARVASDLIDMTRRAADEADECSRDLMDGQRLKVKTVIDTIENMLRRRRRRFRWVRRAGWLAVEWALVGIMWYAWFVVTVARIFLGLGRAILRFGRWLIWL